MFRFSFSAGVASLDLSFSIEIGGLWHKKFGVWLPDGLHLWLGNRGVHLYWSGDGDRISFDRLPRDGDRS